MTAKLCLVADIGGTNTRVALAEGVELRRDSIRRYANAEAASLQDILLSYLGDAGAPDLAQAVIALAGPLEGDGARMTNLGWQISRSELAQISGARHAGLLNDLQAQGHALAHIHPDEIQTLISGDPAPGPATKLVVGIGTGFNAAPVIATASGALVPAAESGHASLPAPRPKDTELAQALARQNGFAAIEDVLSGRGFQALYKHRTGQSLGGEEIIRALAEGERRATGTARQFIRILGAVLGDLALSHLPFGGIYLIGGMARALAPFYAPLGLGEAICDKGRFADFMSQFPVYLVNDDYAALEGCASYAQSLTTD